jgi:putative endopeptidase
VEILLVNNITATNLTSKSRREVIQLLDKATAYYKQCIDETKISADGIEGIQKLFTKLHEQFNTTDVKSASGLSAALAIANKDNVFPFFSVHAETSKKEPVEFLINLSQGGIGLTDKSYFLQHNISYAAMIASMLEDFLPATYFSDIQVNATFIAAGIVDLEIKLAEASVDAYDIFKLN